MNCQVPKITTGLVVVALTTSVACARPSTLPAPEIPPSQPGNEKAPSITPPHIEGTSKSWQLMPTSQSHEYTTVTTTIIQQPAAVTTAAAADTVTTKAQYTLSITQSPNSISLTGSINAFTVQAGNRIGMDTPTFSLPISFTGHIQNHEIQFNVVNNNRSSSTLSLPCQLPALTTLTTVQRNLLQTPLQLQTGMTWQDSLSTTSCSGDFPITLTIFRTYKVAGESPVNGTPTIVIDITEKTLSTGEGSQDQHRISINGSTVKSGRFYLDIVTGTLLSNESESQTTLQIQSSGRTQQFLQNSKETTTRM